MNQESLLGHFLSEDCEPFIGGKLLKEIEELYESDVSREHAFNRFNVRLNYGSNRVTIEDEINPGEDGKVEVALSEFKSALRPTS
jgi:hypothetical protein